jgi:TRAP-type C4-dicarboxylate transport system permease small subunit
MFGRKIVLWYDRVLDAMAALAGVLLIFVMVSVSADVAGRYVFGRPIGWVVEFTEYNLLYIPFLAMAWLVREGGHVRIDVVLQAVGPGTRSLVNAGTSLAAALTCGIAAYWAVATTWDNYARDVLTVGIYPIPKFIPLAVIALGLSMSFIEFLRQARRERRQWRDGAPPRNGLPS